MKQCDYLSWLVGGIALSYLTMTSPMQAQIASDATLPDNSSVTTQGKTKTITGGTRAGSNLFHSFEQFSVPTNGVAFFNNAQDIQNIISRVTGESVSEINGTLGANGAANLFLLNPNGIIFGPNASLNIGGSFLASTASSLNFADDTQFSATDPQATPLLTVSVPTGLQFGGNAGRVLVQGSGLAVRPGKTLALTGSDIRLEGGDLAALGGTNLAALGGRIELGSVASDSLVNLKPMEGWSLGYEGVESFGDIQLSQGAFVDASGNRGGDIQIQGKRVTLTDGSAIGALTKGSEPGGDLTVTASDSVELAGGIDVEGQFYQSGLFNQVQVGATGRGGNLTIKTGRLLVQDGAQVLINTFGKGQGGNLAVTASSVELIGIARSEDGKPLTDKFGNLFFSGLFNQTVTTGTGGNILVSTEKLIVREGAQINATTLGTKDAGNLTVQAADIELAGAVLKADGQLLPTEDGLPFPSGLFAGTEENSTGNGGTLDVETERLSLRDGAVLQTTTFGTGDAGDLKVRVSESVELTGKAKGSRFPTSLIALSGGFPDLGLGVPEATGRGGNLDLNITTGNLLVQDGAAIAVSSINPTSAAKGAGTIAVTAPTISLNKGDITATTASGDGGNIAIQVPNVLLLRRSSNISTSAGSAQVDGDGGNIEIDTNSIVAVPQENSDITANAFSGKGGNVDIEVQGDIFGLEPRSRQELQDLLGTNNPNELDPSQLRSNDITAISQTNPSLSGQVTINTPDVDPSEGVVALPDVPVNVAVSQGCQATGSQQASVEFFNTGKGGLAPSPYEPLSGKEVWEDVPQGTKNLADAPRTSASTNPPNTIVEAQGWLINEKGEAVLVAEVPTIRSQNRCRLR